MQSPRAELLLAFLLACAGPLSAAGRSMGHPISETPLELRNLWLQFHELELCQELDAVFVFRGEGLEVWCRVENDKTYQKFVEMLEPLRPAFDIELYTTKPPEPDSSQNRDPPPSLWNNAALRDYFRDPFGRGPIGSQISFPAAPGSIHDPNFFLKQRINLFAQQTLEWDSKMRRYAADLPALAALGFGPGADVGLNQRAAAACIQHADNVDKYAEKLAENLRRAHPRGIDSSRKGRDSSRVARNPVAAAEQLSRTAWVVARRVYRFIHPQMHTVGLMDLREPSLLESLGALRRMASALRKSAESAR